MAASVVTVRKRVIDILDAAVQRTFVDAVRGDVLNRNIDAITQACYDSSMQIARAVVSNPKHAHRNLYVSGTPTALTHQGELPDMSAEMDQVEIQLYNGAGWTTGTPRTVQQIESYRLNPSSLYSDTAHTASGSPLGGYYAIHNGRIYFTGYAARGYFPLIATATSYTLVPDEYVDAWVCLTVPLCVKKDDGLSGIAQHYQRIGEQALVAINQMETLKPLPTVEQAARGGK